MRHLFAFSWNERYFEISDVLFHSSLIWLIRYLAALGLAIFHMLVLRSKMGKSPQSHLPCLSLSESLKHRPVRGRRLSSRCNHSPAPLSCVKMTLLILRALWPIWPMRQCWNERATSSETLRGSVWCAIAYVRRSTSGLTRFSSLPCFPQASNMILGMFLSMQ